MNGFRFPIGCLAVLLGGCFHNDSGANDSTGSTGAATGTGANTTQATSAGDTPATTSADTTPPTGSADGTTTNSVDSTTSDTGPGSEATTSAPVPPEIDVTVDGATVQTGDTIPLNMTVDVGASLDPVPIVITNVGGGTLDVTGVNSLGPDDAHFAIDDTALAAMLGPSESAEIDLTFSPLNGGIKDISFEIANNDSDEGSFTLTFTANTTPQVYRQVTTTTSPGARFNTAMAALPDGQILLFGGRLADGTRTDDTWIFDPELSDWTDISSVPSPSPRDAHEMVYLDDDIVLLFGGTDVSGMGGPVPGLNDTWVFDVPSQTWSNLGVAGPGPRFQHMMVPLGEDALLFGGRSGGAAVPGTFRYDQSAGAWLNTSAMNSPPAVFGAALGFDGDSSVVLYGGFADNTTLIPATYVFSTMTNSWVQPFITMNPGNRAALEGAFLDDGAMMVFSGKLGSCCIDPMGGTWTFDPSIPDWSDVTTTEPTPRFNYAMAAVPGRNKAIIYGGLLHNTVVSSALDETWEYVGSVP